MVEEARPFLAPRSLRQPCTCAKFFCRVLPLIGLSVLLLLFGSWVIYSSGQQATKPSVNAILSPSFNGAGPTPFGVISQVTQREKCDLFDGEWVPHPAGPAYTNLSCSSIQPAQNCMLNGRPDMGYLYWRWKPKECDLPLFHAERFLNAMRNTWWAFIGDSLSRNHIQSLLCLLSQVEMPMEVFHDKEWKSRRWHFFSYNITLSVIWSPFLVKAETFEDINGVLGPKIHVHLDILHEEWAAQLMNFDYVVTAGGQWFLKTAIYYENNKIVGCHSCPGKNLTELGYDYGYRKALNLVLRHFASSDFKGTVLFKTSAPDHFENGEWSTGGTCKRTHPFKAGEATLKEVQKVMRKVEMEAFKPAVLQAQSNGVDLRLMDLTYLSLLRPDGHPGPYGTYQPFANGKETEVLNDCLHWCLPGPIDIWNDLLMEMVLHQAR